MALPGLEGYASDGSSSSSSSSSHSSTDDDATKILPFAVTTTIHPLSKAIEKKTVVPSETESKYSNSASDDDESTDDDLSIDAEPVAALNVAAIDDEEEEEAECSTEAPRTKNEIVDVPVEPAPLNLDLEGRELSIAGYIISVIILEGSVVVMSAPGLAPLDEDTVLCCTMAATNGSVGSSSTESDNREEKLGAAAAASVLGCINEVFGPISKPHYFIRCHPKRLSELKKAGALLEPGSTVMSVGGMTSYLAKEVLLSQRIRGCDASDAFDEELPPDQAFTTTHSFASNLLGSENSKPPSSSYYHHLKVEFSDDEKEMVAKGGRRKKRGSNGKGKGGWDEDSGGRTKRDQECINRRFNGRVVHSQCRLQQKMLPNYQRPPQQQQRLPFSPFQLYNREEPTCAALQHQWVETRQRGVTSPIQQNVGPANYQCQQEIHGHHDQFQFQQRMHLQQQYLPNLQPQRPPHHSTFCDQPLHFNQAPNQCWSVPHPPSQPPPLPSTPYHALSLVPSYNNRIREGGPTFDSSSFPQDPAHDPAHD